MLTHAPLLFAVLIGAADQNIGASDEAAAFLDVLAGQGKLAFDTMVEGVAGKVPYTIRRVSQDGCVTSFALDGKSVSIDWTSARMLTWSSDNGRVGYVTVDNRNFRVASLGDAGLVAQTFGAMRSFCKKEVVR